MCEATVARQNTDASRVRDPRDELTSYLSSPLEEVLDIFDHKYQGIALHKSSSSLC
jgi:hypothetical protein